MVFLHPQRISHFSRLSYLALNSSFCKFACLFSFKLYFFVVAKIQQLQCVIYQILFNLEIQRRVSHKTWCMVDFQHPGLEFMIKEDVETKNFKAHTVVNVVGLAGAVSVSEHRLN